MSSRVAFVTSEYRTIDRTNAANKATSGNARIVSLTTYLDLAGATQRADEEMAALAASRVFEVTIERVVLPQDFVGGPPRMAIYSEADGLNGDVFTVFEVGEVNLEAGTSVLKAR